MRFGQTDQPADLPANVQGNVLLGETCAELFIVRSRGIVDDIVPPDRFRQYLALGRREALDARDLVETILDMS